MTAHWGLPDPAAVEGDDDKKRHAFVEAYAVIKRRIDLFTSLPMDKLDRLALHEQVKSIGKAMRLSRRLLAEGLGTAALLAIVVGSGIMGANLADGNAAIALLANSLATGFGLFVLISIFGPLSGAHFNPVVSGMALRQGTIEHRVFMSYVLVQVIAAVVGVWLAHAMFGVPVLDVGTQQRNGLAQWTSEMVATAGLVFVIRGTANRRTEFVAAAVGAYIAAAYWFTASTSFANPAVTIARSLTFDVCRDSAV